MGPGVAADRLGGRGGGEEEVGGFAGRAGAGAADGGRGAAAKRKLASVVEVGRGGRGALGSG